MRRMSRTGQDALVVVWSVSIGEDVLLTEVLPAALGCAEYAAKTTLRLLSSVTPNAPADIHTTTQSQAMTADTGTVGVPIRQPHPNEVSEVVRFALDQQAYEIDLRPEDADALRAAFGQYIAAGRPRRRPAPAAHGRRPSRPGRPGGSPRGRRHDPEVGPRARTRGLRPQPNPASVREAYRAAE